MQECEEHHPGQQPEPHLPAGHAGDGPVHTGHHQLVNWRVGGGLEGRV